MKKCTALFCLFLLLLTAGCANPAQQPAEKVKLQVYTSIYPLADFTQKLGGDQVQVTCLIPPAADSHDYEPTAKDMTRLNGADVFFYNGLHMEGFIDQLKTNVSIPFVQVTSGAATEEESNDPHVWLSPRRAKKQLENIKKELIRLDPQNQEQYERRFLEYAGKCDDLDAKLQSLSGKTIVVSHSAYGYLARDYGITMIAADNAGNGDVSPAKMQELVNTCKTQGISTIYYEEGGSDKIAAAIARECGGKTAVLNAFESAKAGKEDYFTVMEQNYQAIKEG